MEIVAIQESFTDYPEHLSIILFVKKCNWDCLDCQNKYNLKNIDILSEDYIFKYIKQSTSLFNHYVISGGEPTVYSDLPEFLRKIKDSNPVSKIKLDTNGSNSKILEKSLPYLNAVSMDIKSGFLGMDFSTYSDIAGIVVEQEEIINSIKLLSEFSKRSNLVEFRTTLVDKNKVNVQDVLLSIESVIGDLENINYNVNSSVIRKI